MPAAGIRDLLAAFSMLTVLRIVFTGAFGYVMWQGAQEGPRPGAGDTTGAYYLGVSLILAILTGIVWAPAVGAMIVAPIDATLNTGSFIVEEHRSLRLVYWMLKKKRRGLAVFFCMIEALNHPDWPSAYIIGMKNAKPGSWCERMFAREVWRFDNMQNALAAHEILRRHGVKPPPHSNAQVMWQLSLSEMKEAPPRPPMPLPAAPEPAPLKRNPNIRLFEDADKHLPAAAPDTTPEPAPKRVIKPPTLPLPKMPVASPVSKVTVAVPSAPRKPTPASAPDHTFFGWLRALGRKR